MTSARGGFRHPDDLRELFRAVLIDVLHRIVVGDRELREHRSRPGVTRAAGDGTADLQPQRFARRAHLRRLPKGQCATEEARGRAEGEMGWRLPPGVTFVRAHYASGRIVYDFPTEPFAVYTDDDLFDLEREGER